MEALRRRTLLGECAAEFAGTMILILFGCGVVAQVIAGGEGLGDHNSIAWAWGFGVTMGVYVAGRMTGAHINPAVTVALAAFRGFPWRKVVPYCIAQTGGAILGALLVRWNYTELLAKVDPEHTYKTQIVFSTLPGNGTLPVHLWGGFRDQIIGTAILMICIFAIVDLRNTSVGMAKGISLAPVAIGLSIVAIGMSFGSDAGYAINPARDFGPRLVSFLTGYDGAWRDQYGDLYFWVPIVAPVLGGLIGAAFYELFVGKFLPVADPDKEGDDGQYPEPNRENVGMADAVGKGA